MKEYKRHVLWLDYFNSSLSRSEGRRIPIDRAVKEPKIEELAEAANRLNYHPQSELAKYPQRMQIQSAYVSIEKRPAKKKSSVILEISKVLSQVRGEKVALEAKKTTKAK